MQLTGLWAGRLTSRVVGEEVHVTNDLAESEAYEAQTVGVDGVYVQRVTDVDTQQAVVSREPRSGRV